MMARYVWNVNNNIVALYGSRYSQRNINSEGMKVSPLKFISYKEMQREQILVSPLKFISYKEMQREEKKPHRKFYDNNMFDTVARL